MKTKAKKSKIIGIIQARMGSERLPNKMSLNLDGFPIIEWVISRIKQSKLIDKFVLATSLSKENDYLIEISKNRMVFTFFVILSIAAILGIKILYLSFFEKRCFNNTLRIIEASFL